MTDKSTREDPTSPGVSRRSLDARVVRADLDDEAAALRETRSYAEQGHTAKTLIKRPDLRVVLLVIRAGSRFKEHRTEHGITVQVFSGRLRMHVQDETVDLAPRELLTLEPSVPHDVEALEDAVAVLTLGWS